MMNSKKLSIKHKRRSLKKNSQGGRQRNGNQKSVLSGNFSNFELLKRYCCNLVTTISHLPPLIAIVFSLYGSAIVLKLHGSSMTILGDRSKSLIIGEPRPIRSDEYLRTSPSLIGQLTHPEQPNVSFFSQPSFNRPNLDAYDLLRPEQFIFQHIFPVENSYSAIWWLPVLYLSLGVFFITKRFHLKVGAQFASILIVLFSPGMGWWSNQLIGPLSRILLGIGIFIQTDFTKEGKEKFRNFAKLVLGWWIISGSIVEYQVWTLVLGLIFLPSILFCCPFRKKAIKTHLVALLTLLPLFLYFFISNFKIISILNETTYPGQRRSQGGLPDAIYWMFTGPFDYSLLNPETVSGTNQSEFSLGFAAFLIPLIYVLLKYSRELISKSWEFWAAISTLLFYAWILLPTPDIFLFPLKLIPPQRALTAVSVITPLIFFLCSYRLSQEITAKTPRTGELRVTSHRFLLAIFASFMSLMSYDYMLQFISPLRYSSALLTASILGISVFYSTSNSISRVNLGLYLVLVLSTIAGSMINPISKGLDTYISNEFSSFVKSSEISKTWATDSLQIDALLIANGRTLLSGQQMNGPNFDSWRSLDPNNVYIQNWNSGASFVTFRWLEEKVDLAIVKANPDVIQIISNPCDSTLRSVQIDYIASRGVLLSPCLTKVYESKNRESFSSSDIFVYQITKG